MGSQGLGRGMMGRKQVFFSLVKSYTLQDMLVLVADPGTVERHDSARGTSESRHIEMLRLMSIADDTVDHHPAPCA